MVSRRDVLIGLGCLGAGSGAYALRPRRHVRLLGDEKLDAIVPTRFAGWTERPTNAIIAPAEENGLAARLYNQTLSRLYVNDAGDAAVMLLIAYGNTQSDTLQLHRPEVCYPAFGFRIDGSAVQDIRPAPGIDIPSRELVATSPQRRENILYWTRIGEFLPVNGQDQRMAKLRAQFQGIIPDGVLVRISNNLPDRAEGLALNQDFARAMLKSIPPRKLPALVGTAAASHMA